MLQALGGDFIVQPADIDEEAVAAGLAPEQGVVAVARAKAAVRTVANTPLLAADTVVVLDGAMLGKPADDAVGVRMLQQLSGRAHHVLTAVCVRDGDTEYAALIESAVNMRVLTSEEIGSYVASGQGRDKAGGYGIQDAGFAPVASIEGCYCNVMGLPLWTAADLLARAGAAPIHAPSAVFSRCAVCPHARVA